MTRLGNLRSAEADLVDILNYITRESGSISTAQRFVGVFRQRCRYLAGLPGTMGRARPELGLDDRSSAYRGYVIYFRYRDGVLELAASSKVIARPIGISVKTDKRADQSAWSKSMWRWCAGWWVRSFRNGPTCR